MCLHICVNVCRLSSPHCIQRPLISNPMKITIIKNISCGVIKDYIKTHEAIMDYGEIRNKVLQMSVFARTENNIKTHKPEAMDISQIMQESLQKIRETRMDKQPTTEDQQTSWKSNSISTKDDVDKLS